MSGYTRSRAKLRSHVTITTLFVAGCVALWLSTTPAQAATATPNLALGRPAVASSLESTSYPASNAVDGHLSTRWSSSFSDPQSIYVDLGSTYHVTDVVLNWETAYGKAYRVQVSTNAVNWTTIYSTTTGTGGVNDLTGLSGTGRYVRLYGIARGTQWGYSLWEFSVYGAPLNPWQQVFYDNFASGVSSSSWGLYSGQPGGDPGGWDDPSHVSVQTGFLTLDTFQDPAFGMQWISGGMSNTVQQTYGKYVVRMRMDAGYGVSGAFMLWPANNQWPPEVDFWEDDGTTANRAQSTATVHYGTTNSQIQHTVNADFTQWHTVEVDWTPGVLAFLLDGKQWATVTGAAVPTIPMVLDIQDEAGTCGSVWLPCPNATTPAHVKLQVASVQIYAYRP